MEFENLKMERIDFTKTSLWRWRVRRIGIGFLLYFYYSYAALFVVSYIFPDLDLLGTGAVKGIAGQHENHYLLMTTFGFLGSIYALSRTFVITQNKIDYPVVWYITRPLQGILMALFLYFAFRAGQLVFFSGGGSVDENSINVYTLSLLAVLAGLFSEHAYTRLFVLAEKLIKPMPRKVKTDEI